MDIAMNDVVQDNSFWAELEEIDCPCQGEGWANIDDEWEACPMHFHGQLHPESRELLLDDPQLLAKSERDSILNWRIEEAKEKLSELQMQLRQAQYNLHLLELEKINKTPTVQMKAVRLEQLTLED
jgi:hypothetical protein